MDATSWSEDDVAKWLNDNGFGEHTKNFLGEF